MVGIEDFLFLWGRGVFGIVDFVVGVVDLGVVLFGEVVDQWVGNGIVILGCIFYIIFLYGGFELFVEDFEGVYGDFYILFFVLGSVQGGRG